MNTFRKFAPNVYVAQTENPDHKKGDIITLETRRGKEVDVIVHNFLGTNNAGYSFYSFTRADGFNSQERAKRKLERLESWIDSAQKKSNEFYKRSNRDSDFLSLGEPIKVGHHSEKRHRNIIDQAWSNMGKSVEYADKAKEHEAKKTYFEVLAEKIDLSMPESLEFYPLQLEAAKEYHKGLKNGTIKREHSFSLTYAKKRVNELTKKVVLAKRLWG